ncbi:MAG: toll/interleukin-1 receptor domain-containing protein [Anaerolineales bacterium]
MSQKNPYVFISYSHSDWKIVEELSRYLEQQGCHVLIDRKDFQLGSSLQSEIEKALNKADIIIVVLSKDAIASNWVKTEIGYAMATNKSILPVLVDDVDLPLYLSQFNFLDLRQKIRATELEDAIAHSFEKLSKR